MGRSLGTISQASIWVNDIFCRGINEFTAPTFEAKTDEGEELALFGTPEYLTGMEPLEIELKGKNYDPDFAAAAADLISIQQIIALENVSLNQGGIVTAHKQRKHTMRGQFKESSSGELAGKERAEFEYAFSCSYYKQEYEGRIIVEFDVFNNIYITDGVDRLAQMRVNLGLT